MKTTSQHSKNTITTIIVSVTVVVILALCALIVNWKNNKVPEKVSDEKLEMSVYQTVSMFQKDKYSYTVYRSEATRRHNYRTCDILRVTDPAGNITHNFSCDGH